MSYERETAYPWQFEEEVHLGSRMESNWYTINSLTSPRTATADKTVLC